MAKDNIITSTRIRNKIKKTVQKTKLIGFCGVHVLKQFVQRLAFYIDKRFITRVNNRSRLKCRVKSGYRSNLNIDFAVDKRDTTANNSAFHPAPLIITKNNVQKPMMNMIIS